MPDLNSTKSPNSNSDIQEEKFAKNLVESFLEYEKAYLTQKARLFDLERL